MAVPGGNPPDLTRLGNDNGRVDGDADAFLRADVVLHVERFESGSGGSLATGNVDLAREAVQFGRRAAKSSRAACRSAA